MNKKTTTETLMNTEEARDLTTFIRHTETLDLFHEFAIFRGQAAKRKPPDLRADRAGRSRRYHCSLISKRGCRRACRCCRPNPTPPRQSTTRSINGRRLSCIAITALPRPITMRPNAHCARSPWGGRISCSGALTAVVNGPRQCMH